MGYNGIFIILDSLFSLLSPICLYSLLFLSLIKIIVSFVFSTRYQSLNLRFLVAALDLPVIACTSSLHYSGGPQPHSYLKLGISFSFEVGLTLNLMH